MNSDKPVQNILCVRRASLFKKLGHGQFEGFLPCSMRTIKELIADCGEYLPRTPELEKDDSIKQIIPQIALVYGDMVCIHQIPDSGSEERLRKKWPILFGGHLEEGDLSFFDGAEREFREEVKCNSVFARIVLGVLNVDNQDEVSRCHAGVLIVFVADSGFVLPTGDEGVASESLEFLSIDQLFERRETLTAWSQAALPVLSMVIENGMLPESPWGDFGEPQFINEPSHEVDRFLATVLNGAPGEKVEVPLRDDRIVHVPEPIKTAIFETVGEASMMWSETPKGVFESTKAKEIAERLCRTVVDYYEGQQNKPGMEVESPCHVPPSE